MVVDLCEYSAAFNYALLTGQRSFVIHPTVINHSFTKYLIKNGYILGSSKEGSLIQIFPYHSPIVLSRVKSISSPSRPIFFGPHRIRHELNIGNRYVFMSQQGYLMDSYQCVFSNLGGQVLVLLALFLSFLNVLRWFPFS